MMLRAVVCIERWVTTGAIIVGGIMVAGSVFYSFPI